MKILSPLICFPSLALVCACGGGSGTTTSTGETFETLTIFSNDASNAGVGRGIDDGTELYYIAPDIVADVAASNSTGSRDAVDITQFPVISQLQGYYIRQGTVNGMNVLVAERIGSGKAQLAYLYENSRDAVAAGIPRLVNTPVGTHTYTGLYLVGNRGSTWKETGTAVLTADFSSGTFNLNATSNDTTLSGNGYLDTNNGRLSSASLAFSDVVMGNYTASTYGKIGGTNGTEAAGVWHTNDTAPDFAGAYAVSE
jgi:hypothetical protein